MTRRMCNVCLWTPGLIPHDRSCKGTVSVVQDESPNIGEIRTTSSTGGQKGVKLARFDLIPIGPLTHLAEHYGRGAQKYADHQWRKGIDWSKLYAALQRHLTAFWVGVELDTCPPNEDGCSHVTISGEPYEGTPGVSCYNHTGSHHLDAVMWMAFALRDAVDNHPNLDDRYKSDKKGLIPPEYICKSPNCKNLRDPHRSFCDDCAEIP